MSSTIRNFRKNIPVFLKFFLGHEGRSIACIEQDRKKSIPGDARQEAYKNMPIWHSRSELMERLAIDMKIGAKHWGSSRTSADFYNAVDQEIAKMRYKKMLVDWNSSRHVGIFRLLPQYHVSHKPAVTTDAASKNNNTRQSDSGDYLKRTFITILARGRKANTYKFALARALLEYCKDAPHNSNGVYKIPYEFLAGKFLEYYWHQECKFRIKQDFNTKSVPRVIEAIRNTFVGDPVGNFADVDESKKRCAELAILKTVFGNAKSKTSLVVPKFQKVMEGNYAEERKAFYDYDDGEKIITLKPEAFAFFKNNNSLLSRVVLVEWAKFLERINGSLPRLVAKIEQDKVRRESLNKFRHAFRPHMAHCFYCLNRLEQNYTHVDHFLPWSYIFEDEAWNLVLTCRGCNLKKSDSLPQDEFRCELIRRNGSYKDRIKLLDHSLKIIDTKIGWEQEICNHYDTCLEYGFNIIRMP